MTTCSHAVYDTDPERPCGRPAITRAWDPEDECWFPVCEQHESIHLRPQVEQFDLGDLTPTQHDDTKENQR